ncbi:MAG TPA: hypothetical protein VJ400_07150 [Thermoplasmata archaeon]|nr:hypothetical protein [Thermoplasmata archaeon]
MASPSTPSMILPGVPLPEPQGVWFPPETVDSATGDVWFWRPSLAVEPSGNAFVVWSQFNADGFMDIWANRYDVQEGWGVAEVIEEIDTFAMLPDVAVDGLGNAIAVWEQVPLGGPDARAVIWANRYADGEGWGTAVRIQQTDLRGTEPAIGADTEGNAIAIWFEETAPRTDANSVWSNRFLVGQGWGVAERIDENPWPHAWGIQLAVDGQGDAIAAWTEYDASLHGDAWYNRFVAGAGWGAAERLETSDAEWTGVLSLRGNRGGTTFAVWDQLESDRVTLWARRYDPVGGWDQPFEVGILASFRAFPSEVDVAVDDTGNAFVVWDELVANETSWKVYMRARRYETGVGWTPASLVDSYTDWPSPFGLAMNPSGQALVTWSVGSDIRASRYDPNGGWESPIVIHHQPWLWGQFAVGTDNIGRGMAAWVGGNDEGHYDLFVSRFHPSPEFATPPVRPWTPYVQGVLPGVPSSDVRAAPSRGSRSASPWATRTVSAI